jgi:hypothetical protein
MVYFQSEDEARFATELVLNKKGLTYDDVFWKKSFIKIWNLQKKYISLHC